MSERTGWMEYTGAREKQMHSIRLKAGTEHEFCYPNGNSWFIYGEGTGRSVPDEDVAEIKNLGYCVGTYICSKA